MTFGKPTCFGVAHSCGRGVSISEATLAVALVFLSIAPTVTSAQTGNGQVQQLQPDPERSGGAEAARERLRILQELQGALDAMRAERIRNEQALTQRAKAAERENSRLQTLISEQNRQLGELREQLRTRTQDLEALRRRHSEIKASREDELARAEETRNALQSQIELARQELEQAARELTSAKAELKKQISKTKAAQEAAAAKSARLGKRLTTGASKQRPKQPAVTRGAATGNGQLQEPSALPSAKCEAPQTRIVPLPAGRARISFSTECYKGKQFKLQYSGVEFGVQSAADGTAEIDLDMFAGNKEPAILIAPNGQKTELTLPNGDLDTLVKIAVLWRAPVNLDLHAIEYAARRNSDGHVWAGSPGTFKATSAKVKASRRGHGYLSRSDDGTTANDHVEIYTLLRARGRQRGIIELHLDFETRGSTATAPYCGEDRLASIEFTIVRKYPKQEASRRFSRLAPLPCGTPIPNSVRFNRATIEHLRVR